MLVNISAFAQQRAVFGAITDTEGNPITEVSVSLEIAQHPLDGKKSSSDRKGRYAFRDFKPGNISITFSKDGFLNREVSYLTSEERGRDKFDVVLYREGEATATDTNSVDLVGKVHDSKGNPLGGVLVTCYVEGTPFNNEVVSGPDGSFTLKALISNENSLRGSLKEYRDQIVKVKVFNDEVDLSDPKEFVMKTIDEAYAEMGIERPEEEKITPEQEAVELFNLAVEPYQQGNFGQAAELAKKALEKDPNQEAAIKLLVHASVKLKEWPDVLTYSEKYLKFKPDDTNVMQAAAQAAQLTNNTEKLSQYKNQLKDKGVINKDSLWEEAVGALNANDDVAALKSIKEIMELDPKDSRAYFELGKIKVREYEFETAIKYLKQYMGMVDKSDKYYAEAKELILTLAE